MAGSSSTTRIRSSLTVHRDGEREAGAAGRRLDHGDGAAVGVDDRLADGQADAARLAPRAPAERLEDGLALKGQQAGALVLDGDLDGGGALAGRHPNGALGRRVADRVLQ